MSVLVVILGGVGGGCEAMVKVVTAMMATAAVHALDVHYQILLPHQKEQSLAEEFCQCGRKRSSHRVDCRFSSPRKSFVPQLLAKSASAQLRNSATTPHKRATSSA